MRKLLLVCFCISISFLFTSCNNAKETDNSNSGTFAEKKTEISESMLERIENLEKEVNSLKDAISRDSSTINRDTIINALDDINGDNILLSMENEEG
ncbi:MAG TPA: hypothetical protein VHT96_18200 [Clostridia bacterium]|nr:hypothetical protein [Clostridia bacterium]